MKDNEFSISVDMTKEQAERLLGMLRWYRDQVLAGAITPRSGVTLDVMNDLIAQIETGIIPG